MSTIIAEIWKLISNPTIFIALLVFITIETFRDEIGRVFPAMKELTAGSFSAKFAYPDAEFPLSKTLNDSSVKDKTSSTRNMEVIEAVIKRLGEKSSKVLLKVDNLTLSVFDFVGILEEEKLFETDALRYKDEKIDLTFAFYDGALKSFWTYVIPHLMNTERIDGGKLVRFNFKTGVKELIEAHLKELEAVLNKPERQ